MMTPDADPNVSFPDVMLTAADVARVLDISVRTVWRMVQQGRFPQPRRMSRKLVRWQAEDLKRWLASSSDSEA